MAEERRVSHETYKNDIADGTMPFNWDEGPHDGIKCMKCDEVSPEEEYEWVDTTVWVEVKDSGIREYDVTRIWLRCPECEGEWPADM